MKNEKNVWHHFDESAFDEELGFLNAMSEKGWQLAGMRVFTQRFVHDDSIVYRYAIDHQFDLSAGEFSQYSAEYEDQGWAYVAKCGNWFVFRRPYDSELPEEEYLLYTDEPSFRDMKSRVNFAVNLAILSILPHMLIHFVLAYLILAAAWVLWLVDNIARRRRFRKIRRIPKPYRFHLWRYSTILFLLLVLVSFFFLPSGWDFYMKGQTTGVQSAQFIVKKPDFIALNMLTYTPKDAEEPIQPVFLLIDESGHTVDSGRMDTDGNPTNEFLHAGTYTLTVDWDAARAPGEGTEANGTSYRIYLTPVSLVQDTIAFYTAWLVLLIVSFGVLLATYIIKPKS